MEIVEATERGFVVSLTGEDLSILQNALNEICNGPAAIDDWEFQTRVGVERDEATALLHDMIRSLQPYRTTGDA